MPLPHPATLALLTPAEGAVSLAAARRLRAQDRARKIARARAIRESERAGREVHLAALQARPSAIAVALAPAVPQWLSNDSVHSSHTPILTGGIVGCLHCGCWIAVQPRKDMGLARPCLGVVPQSRRSRIARLRSGRLPYGVHDWPDHVAEPQDGRSVWRLLPSPDGWKLTTSPMDTVALRRREVAASAAISGVSHRVDHRAYPSDLPPPMVGPTETLATAGAPRKRLRTKSAPSATAVGANRP